MVEVVDSGESAVRLGHLLQQSKIRARRRVVFLVVVHDRNPNATYAEVLSVQPVGREGTPNGAVQTYKRLDALVVRDCEHRAASAKGVCNQPDIASIDARIVRQRVR